MNSKQLNWTFGIKSSFTSYLVGGARIAIRSCGLDFKRINKPLSDVCERGILQLFLSFFIAGFVDCVFPMKN